MSPATVKLIRIIFSSTLILLITLSAILSAGELPYDENTIMLFHFNDDLNGSNGELPIVATGVTIEPGLVGNGLHIHTGESAISGDSLWYSLPQGFNPSEGTIELWIQPKWVGQEFYTLQVINIGEIRIQINIPGNIAFLMLEPDNEYGYHSVQNWQADGWHHIAATWKIGGRQYLYIDGIEVTDNLANSLDLLEDLPDYFTIGSRFPSENAECIIDELRLSNRQRSATEIAQSFATTGLQVYSISLETDSIRLQPGWKYSPIVNAQTNIGNAYLPNPLLTWNTTDDLIAVIDTLGIISAESSGHTGFTGTYNTLQVTGFLKIDTIFYAPDETEVNTYLATPAVNYLYEIPVVIVNYYPLRNSTFFEHIWEQVTLDTIKFRNEVANNRIKFMLEEGSRYHGYKDPTVRSSLGYRIVKIINLYEHMPLSKTICGWNPDNHYPDYHKVFERIDAEYLVNELGVKEFWIWYDGYRLNGIGYELPESNMSSPVTGDISNSGRLQNDLPVYDHFYTVYQFLHSRLGTIHNHGHQLESTLTCVNELQDGNFDLFIRKFCGMDETDTWITGRCGWTHMPPNVASDYIYDDTTTVLSDCMDWHPEGGIQSPVNVATWRDIDYPWPECTEYGSEPPYCLDFSRAENQFYMFWRNNIPGDENDIWFEDSTKVMNNWWEFVANWDEAILAQKGLYTHVETRIKESGKSEVFKLSPAYPNPFNARTIIEYNLGIASQTTIEVYNLLGHKVNTLVNEFQQPGKHRIIWNASQAAGKPLANGIYLIRLEARNPEKNFIKNQKVILLK